MLYFFTYQLTCLEKYTELEVTQMANLFFHAWMCKIVDLFWHILIQNEERNQIVIPLWFERNLFQKTAQRNLIGDNINLEWGKVPVPVKSQITPH